MGEGERGETEMKEEKMMQKKTEVGRGRREGM